MRIKQVVFLLVITVIALLISLYPLNTYITRPGHAFELSPIVEVEGGDEDDEGSLSLMTVTMMQATPALYAWAAFADGYKIVSPSRFRNPHESEAEYNVRQLQLMSESQIYAIQVAYEAAGEYFELVHEGVFVINILPAAAAEGILEPGDRIVSIDGMLYETLDQFTEHLAGLESGDTVTVEAERNGRIIEETIEVAPIPGAEERIGLGIAFTEDLGVESEPDIRFESEDIGGPSAGLMYSLEIYNQLVDEDITHGLEIAGTGTISSDGEVGRIGGIDQKVIAADKAGIEVFFAPNDKVGDLESNYSVAAETAVEIGTDMEIVPIETFTDALEYLETLQPA
ncbi:SepM family pheromone-processing serine protease [Planococcus lenghuensis]|uniref:endopeptidase La n=1 Tax=Planococcus lenghuensis TaxID=2213202 RepID=A0A1Q2L051_9BACL|nr:SepM family pheromone-processing serine protease [Planococcus lenghuensis]AQQ53811.1 peptidase [Planococcus lenghuensis]